MTRDRLFGVLAVLGSILFFVAGFEVYVRIFVDDGMHFDLEMWKYARDVKMTVDNPAIGHQHRPGASARLMGVDVAISSQKLRNTEVTMPPPVDAVRIIMLGDSLTFGWGVSDEETASRRLEEKLRSDGINAEVINAGVGNYNTVMEVEHFLTEGHRFDPDLVVLNYFINDAEPVPAYADIGWLARTSYAYVYLKGRLDILFRKLAKGQDWSAYYRGLYADGTSGWTAAAAGIDDLAQFCRENGIKLLIVNYPELRDLKAYRFDDVSRLLGEIAARNRVPYLDLIDSVRGVPEEKLWVTRPDPHPNGYANQLFADAIFVSVKAVLAAGDPQ